MPVLVPWDVKGWSFPWNIYIGMETAPQLLARGNMPGRKQSGSSSFLQTVYREVSE